jgi:GNAT superfamily N-acetyltransferase
MTFRPARPDEAAEACAVIRRSIIELCGADHDDDPAILDPWLANKTPDRVRTWIETNPSGVIVGTDEAGITGVGAVLPDGRIVLNYAAPRARFRGVSKGLILALEARALCLGHTICTLTSTITAHGFYRTRGYTDAGAPITSFGGKPAFPMQRRIDGEPTSR